MSLDFQALLHSPINPFLIRLKEFFNPRYRKSKRRADHERRIPTNGNRDAFPPRPDERIPKHRTTKRKACSRRNPQETRNRYDSQDDIFLALAIIFSSHPSRSRSTKGHFKTLFRSAFTFAAFLKTLVYRRGPSSLSSGTPSARGEESR